MARKAKSAWSVVAFILIAGLLWWLDHRDEVQTGVERVQGQGVPVERGDYEGYEGCRLLEHRLNDGDSFHVRVPGHGTREFRLYFVDAPESAYKEYRDGNTNAKRLGYQGEYFGGLSRRQTTELGQAAKRWTNEVLGSGSFSVFTRGEKVYDGPREYAFVEVETGDGKRWLHELLVEQGLARIYTQGARTPDGASERNQEKRLKELERGAKQAGRGGWRR